MRHSSTLWAAIGALSLVAAEPESDSSPAQDFPQLDKKELEQRQDEGGCCCQPQPIPTVTVTDCGYYPPIPEPVTETVTVDRTVYTTATVEEVITEYETEIQTQIRTTSYAVPVEVPINCVPAGEEGEYPAYPSYGGPEECSTITTTEWSTTTVLDIITSYRPTTVPTTVEVEVPVPTTVRNTVTEVDTVINENTVTNEVTDRITTTLPGRTVTSTITTTIAADTVTITEDGTTVTRTIPASTVVITTTEVLPGETVVVTPAFDVTLCPRPTGNGEPIDYASDETWGCKPGYVCRPPKPDGCNFFPELPSADFRCAPEDCMVAPPYTNTTWEEGESSYYPPSYGYFHLNPEAFGLSYGIFEYEVYVEREKHTTRTITTGDWTSQATLTEWPRSSSTSTSSEYYQPYAQHDRRSMHWFNRRDITPNVCFDDCDNAALIIQALGKVPTICDPDSDFQNAYNRCAECIEDNEDETKETIRDYIEPEFAQFFSWCEAQESTPTSTPDPEGPESQVETTADVTTSTQDEAVTPTFEPIPTSTPEDEEEDESTTTATTTSSEEVEEGPTTTDTTTTTSEEPAEPTTSAEDQPAESPSPEESPEESAEETTEVTAAEEPEPTPTSAEEEEGEEVPESSSSTIFSVATITNEDGEVITTSSVVSVVPIPATVDAGETALETPEATPSSLPEEEQEEGEQTGEEEEEEGEEEEGSDNPAVVPPPGSPTEGEPVPETPTGPDVVGETGAASAFSSKGSALFVTLASMLAVFFA